MKPLIGLLAELWLYQSFDKAVGYAGKLLRLGFIFYCQMKKYIKQLENYKNDTRCEI